MKEKKEQELQAVHNSLEEAHSKLQVCVKGKPRKKCKEKEKERKEKKRKERKKEKRQESDDKKRNVYPVTHHHEDLQTDTPGIVRFSVQPHCVI